MAEPEVLHSVGFGRPERRVTFNAEESSVSQIAKRDETGRITTLSDHNSTPLLCSHRSASDATSPGYQRAPRFLIGYSDPQRFGSPAPTLVKFIAAYSSSRIVSTLVTEG
jgi:hypothetical protein